MRARDGDGHQLATFRHAQDGRCNRGRRNGFPQASWCRVQSQIHHHPKRVIGVDGEVHGGSILEAARWDPHARPINFDSALNMHSRYIIYTGLTT